MAYLTIGELAKRASVNLETVRYYERRGLIVEPPRTKAGYRMYDESAVDDIRWIRQAQAIGFTLQEILYLKAMRDGAASSEAELRCHAQEKIAEIEKKIEQLQEMKSLLERAVSHSSESFATCPLLQTIKQGRASNE
ncbi:MerR family transcriptional regulator [Paenibacillus sp. FSL W8-0186]|uniref:Hg(II)-responsive transcriptional regulator n=1 Tax=Paenibacillus woosongensis TaxID=307580 RepID=A0ABQ4MLF0_9BACL|nr:MerR family transcriptional regulator [Paenibacillus woosongensis]GIP56245.1 Hg(II)-responsive transcriptional regulator [Paenibacillus woosongensis]